MNPLITPGIALVLIYLSVVYLMVQLKQDTNVGRFGWVGGVLFLSLYSFFITGNYLARPLLVTTLVTVWAVRLIFYVYSRYRVGNDPRFFEWQTRWGTFGAFRSFMWIFIAQGLMLAVMAFPSIVINAYSGPGLNWLDLVALGVWIFGFYFEAVGDYQLYIFLRSRENHGKVLTEGLWALTRHPNYFGELLIWWGIYLFALSVPGGSLTIVTPITITCILFFYSGIPMIERDMSEQSEYEGYKRKTSRIFPWFRR